MPRELRRQHQVRRVKSIRPPRQPIEREEYELEPLRMEKRFLPSFQEQYEAELEARAMPPDKMPQAATILERVVYKALWERGYRPPDLDFQSSMAGGRLEWGFGRQVADFAIHSLGIIIECQGTYWHQFGEQHQRDLEREVRLRLVPRPVPWLVYFLEEPVIRDRYRLELWLNEHVVHAGLRHEQPAAPMVEPQAAPETEGAVVVGSLPDVGDDWTGRSPINHLVNGGFSAGTAGWTSTGDVTVSIVSGKLRLNASVADKGVYQAANGLEPNALYTVACKVSTGGNSARIYTTGGHHNADDTVMTAATATWVGQSLTSSSGVLTIHLTAHTTGVDIDFDDVRLFRGNLAFPFVDDVHDVVGGDHTVDGTSMQLVGLTADDTLGLLTPSADPGAASKVLKSDANGKLALVGLDVDAGSASSPSLTLAGDTNTGIYQSAADNLDVTTGGTRRVNISSSGVGINTSSAAASLLEVSGGFVTADGIGRYKGHSWWANGATKTIVADLPDGMYQVVAVATDENWYLVAWVTMRSGTGEVRATICNQYVTAGFSGDDLQLTNGQPTYGVTIYWAVTSFTGGA